MVFFMIYFMTLLPDFIRNMGGFLVIFPLYFSFVYFLRHAFNKCKFIYYFASGVGVMPRKLLFVFD